MKQVMTTAALLFAASTALAQTPPAAPAAPPAKTAPAKATPAAPAKTVPATPAAPAKTAPAAPAKATPATPPAPAKTAPAAPAAKPPVPAGPPEVKKTVDAFLGYWLMDAMVTLPDGKSVKGKLRFNCNKAAGGKALSCALKGKLPQLGAVEAAILLGYDTFTKAVHFMAMTSDDEVHDHRCSWKTETSLVCDPLRGGSGGQPITEDLSFEMKGNAGSGKSVMTFADGSKATFELSGRR